MSWAALVKAAVPAPAPEVEAAPQLDQARVAVVDANAIISGLQLASVADKFVTTQDVLDEIRDKNARQFLATLQSVLEVQEPEDSSVAAVTAFARETGDLHALSRTDLRLLALAHTLEVAVHGSKHLRQHPVQATVKPKHRSRASNLPGWGTVPNPQDWAALDELPDSAGQGTSRIRTGAQALDGSSESNPTPDGATAVATEKPEQPEPTPAKATAQAQLPFTSFGDAAAADLSTSAPQGPAGSWFSPATANGSAAPAGLAAPAAPAPPPAVADPFSGVAHFTQGSEGGALAGGEGKHVEEEQDDDEEDESEWATAGKSRAAERRQRRNQIRYEARQQRRLEEAAAAAAAAPEQAAQGAGQVAVTANGLHGGEQQVTANGAAQSEEVAQGGTDEEEEEEEGEEEEGEEEEDGAADEGEEEEEEGEEGERGTETMASATDCGDIVLNSTSAVCCVTADFAMQNVLLQMGLRLVTKDGRQISKLSRWAVRCHACFFVTKEAGRAFCPRCGNMTLERVEVTVGPDGAEFYGIRKKHVLKGTMFALPKPKGGRAKNPILREDEMLHRLKPGRREKQAQKDLDPFAPEHGSHDPWGLSAGQTAVANTKGTQYLMAGWKHNPNERKPQASNRRRK